MLVERCLMMLETDYSSWCYCNYVIEIVHEVYRYTNIYNIHSYSDSNLYKSN